MCQRLLYVGLAGGHRRITYLNRIKLGIVILVLPLRGRKRRSQTKMSGNIEIGAILAVEIKLVGFCEESKINQKVDHLWAKISAPLRPAPSFVYTLIPSGSSYSISGTEIA